MKAITWEALASFVSLFICIYLYIFILMVFLEQFTFLDDNFNCLFSMAFLLGLRFLMMKVHSGYPPKLYGRTMAN